MIAYAALAYYFNYIAEPGFSLLFMALFVVRLILIIIRIIIIIIG